MLSLKKERYEQETINKEVSRKKQEIEEIETKSIVTEEKDWKRTLCIYWHANLQIGVTFQIKYLFK